MPRKVYIWGVGWLGFPLAEALRKNNYLVYGISRDIKKIEYLNAIQIPSLTIDEFIIEAPLRETNEGVFIISIPPTLDPSFLEQLHLALRSISQNTHVIYTSSTGIYENKHETIFEDSLLDKNSALYILENIIELEAPLNFTILRLGGLIGPNRHPIHYLIKRDVNLNPSQVVNLINQKDIIELIRLSIFQRIKGIFNLCSDEHPTRKEYYNEAAIAFGYKQVPFVKDTGECGKIIANDKVKFFFPNLVLTSIYDFKKCM